MFLDENIVRLKRKNGTVIIDKDVYEKLTKEKFYITVNKIGKKYRPYMRVVAIKGRSSDAVKLSVSRFVMGARDRSQIVDHISGNPLDNRRANLRICSNTENRRNTGKGSSSNLSSPFKGVSSARVNGKHMHWQVFIRCGGKPIYLGIFKSEIEAAMAYDAGAAKYHKNFARYNFPCLFPAHFLL